MEHVGRIVEAGGKAWDERARFCCKGERESRGNQRREGRYARTRVFCEGERRNGRWGGLNSTSRVEAEKKDERARFRREGVRRQEKSEEGGFGRY